MQQGSSNVRCFIALAAIALGAPCAALAQGHGDTMKGAAQDAAKPSMAQQAQQRGQGAAKPALGGAAPAEAAPADK